MTSGSRCSLQGHRGPGRTSSWNFLKPRAKHHTEQSELLWPHMSRDVQRCPESQDVTCDKCSRPYKSEAWWVRWSFASKVMTVSEWGPAALPPRQEKWYKMIFQDLREQSRIIQALAVTCRAPSSRKVPRPFGKQTTNKYKSFSALA